MSNPIKSKTEQVLVLTTTNSIDNTLSLNQTHNNLASQRLKLEDCDRFKKCFANICPLDSNWQKRKHLAGERVCFYMIEAEKTDAEAVFRDRGSMQLFLTIKEISPEIASCHYPLKYAFEQARKTGSRMTRKAGWTKHGKK